MTKFKGAHMEPLHSLLRSGMYTMRGEREELETRAQQKKTGTVPRNKVSAKRYSQQNATPTPVNNPTGRERWTGKANDFDTN